MTIGRLERLPLREVWKHEEYDFTSWLQENIDILNDIIDISVSNVAREQAAGSFSVDLVGEDENGAAVVIENQLERSNHDHLGKLLTYLTAFEAKSAIWIVSDPRPEHIAIIAWLNQSTSASFYLIKVEAVRIGVSEPAPLLTRIVGPSAESRAVGNTKKDLAENQTLRQKFWTQLIERAKARTHLHASLSPSTDQWISTGAGRTGLALNYFLRTNDARVELYIDRQDAVVNKVVFDQLKASMESIEAVFGESLEWERLDNKRASRIH